MRRHLVAAVTIGQTPRPDLLEPLLGRAGNETRVIELGALDALHADRIPTRSPRRHDSVEGYPLTTRLRDGSFVTLDEDDLAPLVQEAVDRADRAGADVTLLLCAGGFPDLTSTGTLVRPFHAAVAGARDIGARRVAVVVPSQSQASSARRKWEAAGFDVHVVVGDVARTELPVNLVVDAIVLDYVGHGAHEVRALRATASVPVIDLGECGAEAAVAALVRAEPVRETNVR